MVENLSYTNKVVKGTGTCAAIAAVPYKHPKNIEGLPSPGLVEIPAR